MTGPLIGESVEAVHSHYEDAQHHLRSSRPCACPDLPYVVGQNLLQTGFSWQECDDSKAHTSGLIALHTALKEWLLQLLHESIAEDHACTAFVNHLRMWMHSWTRCGFQ